MVRVTEEMHPEKEWFEEAKKQTIETLPNFMLHLLQDYAHDYGTIVHAISACALAAVYAADNHPAGGITGFQAGFIMWDFVREWSYHNNKVGLRMLDMDDLLYPQYGYKFEKRMSRSQFQKLQEVAKANLEENEWAASPVIEHWKKIAAGEPPFGFQICDD